MRINTILALVAATATLQVFAISPGEAADAILSRNGDFIAAFTSLNAANLDAKTMANIPDPEIEGGYKFAPAGEDNRWDIGISYSMEWPGVYGARRNMAKAMENGNNTELNALAAALRLEILERIEEYLLADRKMSLMSSMASATDSLRLVTEKAVRGGQMSRIDLAKISLEQGRLKTLLASAQNDLDRAKGELQALNGGYDCKAILETIDRKDNRQALLPEKHYLEGVENNPEFLKSMAEFMSAQRSENVVKAEALPSLKVGYSHDFEDGMHFNGASLGVSVPIFSNRGKAKAAKAAVAAAEQKMVLVTDRTEAQVKSLYRQVGELDESLKTPDEIFSTTDYPTLLLKALKGGEISLTEYLQERNWFFESHLDYLELQTRRAIAMHSLQSLTSPRP